MKTLCSTDSCQRDSIAKTYCLMHYKRWRKYGNPNIRKSAANGSRKKHPLYATWTLIEPKCVEWSGSDGFSVFVVDMGSRPVDALLKRIDIEKPYSKENCYWHTANKMSCSIQGCEVIGSVTKSMCNLHYTRLRKYGNPLHEYDRANTEETRNKKSIAQLKRFSDPEEVKKFSQIMTGIKKNFKPGYVSPLKGTKRPERSGANHHFWKGGITSENKRERARFYRVYQRDVLKRDNYTCQICSQYGGSLQVDHIQPWSEYPELRFELSNCRTLCVACHYYITFKRKIPEGIDWGRNLNRRIAS